MKRKYNIEYSDDREGVALDTAVFDKSMEIIVEALEERGYDPYAQFIGFLRYKDPLFITRHRNARELIQTMDEEQIRRYISICT